MQSQKRVSARVTPDVLKMLENRLKVGDLLELFDGFSRVNQSGTYFNSKEFRFVGGHQDQKEEELEDSEGETKGVEKRVKRKGETSRSRKKLMTKK